MRPGQTAEIIHDPTIALRERVEEYLFGRCDEIPNPADALEHSAIRSMLSDYCLDEHQTDKESENQRQRLISLQISLNPSLREAFDQKKSNGGALYFDTRRTKQIKHLADLRSLWVDDAACQGLTGIFIISTNDDVSARNVFKQNGCEDICCECPVREKCYDYGKIALKSAESGSVEVYGGYLMKKVGSKILKHTGREWLRV